MIIVVNDKYIRLGFHQQHEFVTKDLGIKSGYNKKLRSLPPTNAIEERLGVINGMGFNQFGIYSIGFYGDVWSFCFI
jgi:hypothetical protein